MNTQTKYTLSEAHHAFAKSTNGETWALLEKKDLTSDEKDLLLSAAFASAYHWEKAGTLLHKQRAEWLISRAYTKLELGECALFHAKKCLDITQTTAIDFQDFDYAYASEAMARAYALLGAHDKASEHCKTAIALGNEISNEKDRELFLNDLRGGNWNNFDPQYQS